jgi:hypothetical protein
MPILVTLLVLLLPSLGWGAFIQYATATMFVEGASDSPPDTVPGYAVVEVTGLASAIVWPVPSGCPAGSGQALWTIIDNVTNVTSAGGGMSVRPGLVFFSTTSTALPGCHRVGAWKELKRLMDEAIVQTLAEEDLVLGLGGLNQWYEVRCPPADAGNQNCINWQTQLTIVNDRYPGRGQGITVTTSLATLVEDAFAFKTAQGW